MHHPPSTPTRPPRPRLGPGARLIAGLVVAAAVVAGITTACSSSSSPSHASGQASGQASSSGGALAFSACMRSHGVPNFPDPTSGSNGNSVELQQGSGIDPNSQQYQSAMHACQSLLPAGKANAGSVSPTVRTQYLRYAACMRSHGEPNYPDPTFNGNSVNLGNLSGIDTNSPQYQSASHACASLNPMNRTGYSK